MGHVFGRFIMLWTGVSDMLNENSRSNPNGEVLPEEKGNIAGSNFLRIDWLGQTLASFCWIVSVFVYGYASGEGLQLSTGDWLQLAAASSWFIANMAALAND